MLHAGWKGIAQNIHQHELIKQIEPYYFFIGPCASVNRYEVQEDFRQHFLTSQSFTQNENKTFFNLAQELTERLKKYYPQSQIQESHLCTISNLQFHSFRRNQTSNRNWNLFIPNEN